MKIEVKTRDDFSDDYYTVPNPKLLAGFSTDWGRRPKRLLRGDKPARVLRSNIWFDITIKANKLGQKYPEKVREIKHVVEWVDLHEYFDPYDLYTEGPTFCGHVINELARRGKELAEESQAAIEDYAQDWILSHQQ